MGILSRTSQLDRLLHLTSDNRDSALSFTKDIDEMVCAQEADLACHSAKDVGIWVNHGLQLVCALPRCYPADAWFGPRPEDLPKGAVVGTDSARRQSLIKLYYPHLAVKSIRGNVGTRIQKWQSGEYDAIMLSQCGVDRLNLDVPYYTMPLDQFVPAMNQGIIVAMMSPEHPLFTMISETTDQSTWQQMMLERKVGRALGVTCKDPVGILAKPDGTVDVYWGRSHVHANFDPNVEELSEWCAKLKG